MAAYVLTPQADDDLKGIWDYSFDTWGADQADKYLKQIEDCCKRIAAGKAQCRWFPTIDPDLGSHHCHHHHIFFLNTEPKPTIIAILHERMDLLNRLMHRLR